MTPPCCPLGRLVTAALKVRCADELYVPSAALADARKAGLKAEVLAGYRAAPAADQKKQLPGTAASKLKLVGAQATKVNAWIRTEPAKAVQFLAPTQRAQVLSGAPAGTASQRAGSRP